MIPVFTRLEVSGGYAPFFVFIGCLAGYCACSIACSYYVKRIKLETFDMETKLIIEEIAQLP